MSTLIPFLTYRVIRMHCNGSAAGVRYVAVAWNYDYGQLMSTAPRHSYTDARKELDELVEARRCKLRWFDGEYDCQGDYDSALTPVPYTSLPRETEDDIAHQA